MNKVVVNIAVIGTTVNSNSLLQVEVQTLRSSEGVISAINEEINSLGDFIRIGDIILRKSCVTTITASNKNGD